MKKTFPFLALLALMALIAFGWPESALAQRGGHGGGGHGGGGSHGGGGFHGSGGFHGGGGSFRGGGGGFRGGSSFHGGGGGRFSTSGGFRGGSRAGFSSGFNRGGFNRGFNNGFRGGFNRGFGRGFRGGRGWGGRGWGWGGWGWGWGLGWGWPYWGYGYGYPYGYYDAWPYYGTSYYYDDPYDYSYDDPPPPVYRRRIYRDRDYDRDGYRDRDDDSDRNGGPHYNRQPAYYPDGASLRYDRVSYESSYRQEQRDFAPEPAPRVAMQANPSAARVNYVAQYGSRDVERASAVGDSATTMRPEVLNAMRVLREMPPVARERAINSGRYSTFTAEERELLRNGGR